MNTDYYRTVLKVAELCNITKTAKEIGYTQSGVSHIISRVEEDLNVKIFVRSREGMEVHADAFSYLEYMKKIVELEDQLLNMESSQLREEKKLVRIATLYTIADTVLSALLKEFFLHHKKITLSIREQINNIDVIEDIKEGLSDVGFVDENASQNLQFYPIYKDRYYMVFPLNSPLSTYDEVGFEDIKGEPFIVPEEAMAHKILRDCIQEQHCINDYLPHRDCMNDNMTLRLVEQGFGVSVVPGLYLYQHKFKLHARLLANHYAREMGIVAQKDNMNQAEIIQFIKFTEKWMKIWESKNRDFSC